MRRPTALPLIFAALLRAGTAAAADNAPLSAGAADKAPAAAAAANQTTETAAAADKATATAAAADKAPATAASTDKAPLTAAAADKAPETVDVKAGPNAARVVTCAVSFPLDSVKFSEDQVQKCMAAVDAASVSYVHVIATADETGTHLHNLYLSTRRAGAIEAYLANRFPAAQVHAFGGGENPRFGKLARIFIVEHKGDDHSPVQVASVGVPEIIERTKTETITKTVTAYRDVPKRGFLAATEAGGARMAGTAYGYVGVGARQIISFNIVGPVAVGVRHRVLQSDKAADIQSTVAQVAREWPIGTFARRQAYFDQAVELGRVAANDQAVEWGATSTVGLRDGDFEAALIVAKSNVLSSLGFGLGVRL